MRQTAKPGRNFRCNVPEELPREDEILGTSAFADICEAPMLHLQQLEKALLLIRIDHQQTTVIRHSNLFARLLDLFKRSPEKETRCLILRCISEAMENMHRNEVFEIVEMVSTAQLGSWCVEQLTLAMAEDDVMLLALLNFAGHLVKVSTLERDCVVVGFILPQIRTVMTYPNVALFVIENATLHDCHSRHMSCLLEDVLSISMMNAPGMLQRRSSYESLLNIVNNYLFDDPGNIQICMQYGFHDYVWGVISETRHMSQSEMEFIMSLAQHIHPVVLLCKFRHLTGVINRDATNSTSLLALILTGTQRSFADDSIHTELQKEWLKLFLDEALEVMAKIPSMAFSEKMALTDLTGWLL